MNQNELRNPTGGTGYLIVRASTALGAIPVEGATVTVRNHLAEGFSPEFKCYLPIVTGERRKLHFQLHPVRGV